MQVTSKDNWQGNGTTELQMQGTEFGQHLEWLWKGIQPVNTLIDKSLRRGPTHALPGPTENVT